MARKSKGGEAAVVMDRHDRFMAKVDKRGDDECWLWLGTVNNTGYGVFSVGIKGRNHSEGAHRFAYLMFNGEIPEGLHIDHLCGVRRCVNPNHLEAVTSKENNRRSSSPSAKNGRKTHCKYGHPFTPENTYMELSGRGRSCRTCNRERTRRYRLGQKAA